MTITHNYEQCFESIPYFRQRISEHPKKIGDFVIDNITDDKKIPVRIGMHATNGKSDNHATLEITIIEELSGHGTGINVYITYRGPEDDTIVPKHEMK